MKKIQITSEHKRLTALQEITYELFATPEVGKLLDELESMPTNGHSQEQQAVIRETCRDLLSSHQTLSERFIARKQIAIRDGLSRLGKGLQRQCLSITLSHPLTLILEIIGSCSLQYRKHFPEQLKRIDFYALSLVINAVTKNLVFVDSDFKSYTTYTSSCIVHWKKMLIERTLKVEDLPQTWNRLSQ